MRRPAAADKQNAQAPRLAGAPTHLDRFIVELLRSIVVAVQHGDVGEDQTAEPPCCTASPPASAASRASSDACRSLLVVAEFKRGKPLKKQRERHDPGITVLAAQRQRLGRQRPSLDVTPLEVVHVRQTRSAPAPAAIPARERQPRAPVRARASPPRTDRASSRTRTARQRARRPSRPRAEDVRAHSSAARTFSCSIRSRLSHASLTVAAEDGQCPTELVEEKLEMPLAQSIGGAGLHEPFARILADRLEEAVPALAGELARPPLPGTC